MEDPTRTYDPVCGMVVGSEQAAARLEVDGRSYFFCTVGCSQRFQRDPGRLLDPADESEPHTEVASPEGRASNSPPAVGASPCACCGEAAHALRAEPAVGRLSVEEFAALGRVDWRYPWLHVAAG